MTSNDEIRRQFETDGRLWLRNALSAEELQRLKNLLHGEGRPGGRVAPGSALFNALCKATFTQQIGACWPAMRPVRVVSFDKNSEANWGVPWHQDRIIAVDQKVDLPGYENWSCKSGTWHCEPPQDVLDEMLFVRVHLDRNTQENGAMEVALGSHHAGRCPTTKTAEHVKRYRTEITEAAPGDVLVLKMLTLHRSLPSVAQSARRVLRIDMADDLLPQPLGWAV